MATKYVSSENLEYFYSKIKAIIDTKLDASKAYSHPNSGVTAGTYKSVTVNAQGHVTGGSNPTTLAGYGITDAAAKNHTHNYAGSSSAGGAANSAVKLATARTINGVSFDGTANISLTANPTANQLTSQNLNDTKTPAFYYAAGGNTVTNKPDGVPHFALVVMKSAGSCIEQVLIDGGTQKIWMRTFDGNAWSAWSYAYTTLNKPSKSDVGLGSVENKSSATIRGELTKDNVTKALGYTPPTTNTTYGTGTASASGLTKLYTSTGSNTDGAMTQKATTDALNGKANSSHTHQSADIVSLDAGKLTGTISIDRLPAGALERCIVVADDTARKALTTAKAQNGDTVKVTSTGRMYMIVDDTKLNADAGYLEYTAGSASSVPWSGVTGKPTTLGGYGITDAAAKNHTHNYAGSSSAGGAANSVANSIAIKLNGGTTEGTNLFTYNGSAGKTINITPAGIGAAASGHTHNYAGSGSAGGSANSAVKLDTATAGSATQPVYFSGGKPVATTYTLGKSVPSNAVFTDTWRGIQNNLTSDSTTDSLSAAQGKALKSYVDSKVPFTRWDVTVKCATWSRLCLVAYGTQTTGSSFILNVKATRSSVVYNETLVINTNHSQKATIVKIGSAKYSAIQVRTVSDGDGNCYVELYDNANSATNTTTQSVRCTLVSIHNGTLTKYTAFTDGSTIPTNYAVSATLTTNGNSLQGNLTWGEITGKPSSFTPASHNHNIESLTNYGKRIYDATISRSANTVLIAPNGSNGAATFRKLVAADLPAHTHSYAGSSSAGGAANSVANSIVVKLNGGTTEGTNQFTFNGSAGKSVNITPSAIGAAAASHSHNYAGSSSAGGSANSAVKLATARTISLTGDATGSASFDGSANASIAVTVTAMTNTEIDKLFA